jgi:hypothetical protein
MITTNLFCPFTHGDVAIRKSQKSAFAKVTALVPIAGVYKSFASDSTMQCYDVAQLYITPSTFLTTAARHVVLTQGSNRCEYKKQQDAVKVTV